MSRPAPSGGRMFPEGSKTSGGMTRRQWYAGQALQGIVGCGIPGSDHVPENAARLAWQYADALLAAEERDGG